MSLLTLEEQLAQSAVPGTLVERLQDGAVRCVACGHRCLIREGRRGVCLVRFNRGGTLYVPRGYVGALQCDPIEKKPFFHVLPGVRALSFGMLGCDYHCSYCLLGSTPIVTTQGVVPISAIFESADSREHRADGDVAYPTDTHVITESGARRRVTKAFRHVYHGPLAELRPYYFPPLELTPDHLVYATSDPTHEPAPMKAGELTTRHWLAIPRRPRRSSTQEIDVTALLSRYTPQFVIPRCLDQHAVTSIMELSAQGVSSRTLGLQWGKHPSYIRHVRSKVRRGRWRYNGIQQLVQEGVTVRFSKEHRPGIARHLTLTPALARLLGLYCAEGCVVRAANRPNSATVQWSFGKHEHALVDETSALLTRLCGIEPSRVNRPTTKAIVVSKTSLALVFKELCGDRSARKRVPIPLFDAHREVVEAFVQAVTDGDGSRSPNGKVSVTTVSWKLGYELAWLLLTLGYCPSLYANQLPTSRRIEGRVVHQQPMQYTVVWYTKPIRRKVIETERAYLVPIRSVTTKPFGGAVFNLEVEGEHNYLANFFAVNNCQNWLTSQTLRDPSAGVPPQPVTPEQLVGLAIESGSQVIASTYNEPLITSEWAVEVFKAARARGLLTAYVSNGNATPEVLEYLRPWVDAYKVDLKGFNEGYYRAQLGGQLAVVLDTIRRLVAMGFWVEIVTLVVPGFNDSDDELRRIAAFLASVSPDLPWHVTAFHKDYKMTDPDNTSPETLVRACEIGRRSGLRYLYAGNLPGLVGRWEHTFCPTCKALLVERRGFAILTNALAATGRCPSCQTAIPGIWTLPRG